MRLLKKQVANADEENPYWISFTDIMSALLIIFILAAVVLIIQLMEKQQEFDQQVMALYEAEKVRRTLLHEAADLLNQRGIKVTVSENDTVLSIPNEILGFDTGAYEISVQYRETAIQIGQVLSEVIRKEDRIEHLDTIFVEGHTDNRPAPGSLKGNWGLSAFRAISLWQFWAIALGETDQLANLHNKDGMRLFSVSGYAETRPVREIQRTEEDYRLNRRVDIRFTIRRPGIAEYEAVRNRTVEVMR